MRSTHEQLLRLRRYDEYDSPEGLVKRTRAGLLSSERIQVAASLGHQGALAIYPDTPQNAFDYVDARLNALDLLTYHQTVTFAADCAERVLPIFERYRPEDFRPRRAIEATRSWARREITGEEAGAAAGAAAAACAAYAAAYASEILVGAAVTAAAAAAAAAAVLSAASCATNAVYAARAAGFDHLEEIARQRARLAEILVSGIGA